jgi:hypothetical protein
VGQDREAALFELSGKARLLGRVMGLARNEARGPTEFGDLYLATTNGDRLYILYALRDYDEISSRGTFTIVGGTGRCSNASGGGVMTASAIEGLPYYPITLDGTISF